MTVTTDVILTGLILIDEIYGQVINYIICCKSSIFVTEINYLYMAKNQGVPEHWPNKYTQ